MVIAKAATIDDVDGIVQLGERIQGGKGAHPNFPLNKMHFAEYVSACIASPGLYVFVAQDANAPREAKAAQDANATMEAEAAEEEGKICGLLILNEFTCPWNRDYVWASDLMFIAEKGGPKLVRLSKKMKQLKGWDKLMFSTTTNNPRADKFFSYYGKQTGGVFEVH